MTIEEFSKLDKDFNPTTFISKCNHIFIKYFTAIMMDKLKEVDHFISDDVYKYGENIISPLRNKNLRQMYDELNVKDTRVLSRSVENSKEVIEVELISRYMDYILDLDTGDLVSGDDTRRTEKTNILIFEKVLNTKEIGIVRKCPGCGASISVNTNGKCGIF